MPEQLEKQFPCLGENTEKYMTFTIPTEKEMTRIDKNGGEATKNIPYILQFIDIARFMASSLSNLVKILLKEFIKLNVTMDTMRENMKHVELQLKHAIVFLNTKTLKTI